MKQINKCVLCGYTASVRNITTKTGKAGLHLSVATDFNYQTKDGEWKKVTTFTPVVVFSGSRYITSLEKIEKGTPVLVHGRLNNNTYTDAQGVTHNSLELLATALSVVVKEEATAEEEAQDVADATDDLPEA